MLTASGQQADSIRFTPYETKVLIESWENRPELQKALDACEKQRIESAGIIKADSVLKASTQVLIISQKELIEAQKKESEDLKGQVKRAERRTKVVFGVAVLELFTIIYQIFKP